MKGHKANILSSLFIIIMIIYAVSVSFALRQYYHLLRRCRDDDGVL